MAAVIRAESCGEPQVFHQYSSMLGRVREPRSMPRIHCNIASALTAIVILACSAIEDPVRADALMVTRAMKASTIAEVFIEDQRVLVELEIGTDDLGAFANVLPDDLYAKVTARNESLAKRLEVF